MNTTQAPIDPTTMGMEDPAEVMAARRKQELAMALLKQLQGGAPQPQQTRILAKQSLGNVLMNTAAQSIAGDRLSQADKQMGAIAQRQQGAYSSGMTALMNAPDKKAAIAKALASNNPALKAFAAAQLKALQDAEQKDLDRGNTRANSMIPALANRNMLPEAGQVARTGQVPAQITPPPIEAPKVDFLPDPNNPGKFLPHQIDTKLTGEKSGTLGTPGTSVSVSNNMPGSPGREKEMLTGANIETLQKERIPQARAAQIALGNTARIIEELERGAETGSWQDQKQLLAKVGTLFGVDAPKLGSIDNVKKAMFENVFQKAQALRPVSNEELAILKEQVGSIDTDPQALAHILSWYNAQALRTIQELDESIAPNLKGENSALWQGLRGNIRLPNQLAGPTWFQARTLQDLQRTGGDISQFQDKLGPVPADAQFDIRGTSRGLQSGPSSNRGIPATSKPKPLNEMSDDELQQRLKQLKGG